MPAIDMQRMREQGRRFVEGFTSGQKAVTILGVVVVVVAGMYFTKWAGTPDYQPLYSGLSSADAGAVTQQLDAQGIKYKIAGGGGTILVGRPDVYKTRISLSAKGIPGGGGDSWARFDNSGITTDQFTRNVQYQRAQQDEIARTIESIDTIGAASVTLTIPTQTVFVGDTQDKPSAAVLVRPKGGSIGDDTVNSIVNLVASSIPNMVADDVTVADTNGNMLHAKGMDSTLGGGNSIGKTRAYEVSVENKISDLLATALGPGHAAVKVAADLDMSKHDASTTIVARPGGSTKDVPSESSKSSETFTGPGGSSTGGKLGLDGAPVAGGAAGTEKYNKTTNTTKNAFDNTVDHVITPPGKVNRLSVSVLLDDAAVKTPQDLAKFQTQIGAAAGIQTPRDTLQVATVTFNTAAQTAANKQLAGGGGNAMFDLIKHVLTLIMVGMVLFFAWRAIKKAEANRVPIRVPIDLRELEASGATREPAFAGARVGARAAAERRSLESAAQTIESEITDLIESQPDEVAQTLRSWLADRRT
jgi:flagellar M-ring protein FliF